MSKIEFGFIVDLIKSKLEYSHLYKIMVNYMHL